MRSRLRKTGWRRCLGPIDSFRLIMAVGVQTSKDTKQKVVNAVRGLHRILLATLGGVPRADSDKAAKNLKDAKEIVDKFIDLTDNTLYIVEDDGNKEMVTLKEMIDRFYMLIEHNQKLGDYYKNTTITKVDAAAAEVLYGVKRRYQD